MNKKMSSIALLAIILVSTVPIILLTTPIVLAARGNPPLAGVICPLEVGVTTCTHIVFATYNISVKAGEMVVSKIDGVSYTGYLFAIVFAINDTWIISFDGSWFDLYMSKDGYSALSPDDIKYAGPFYVVDLATPGLKKYTFTNPYLKGGKADFYIGKVEIDGTTYSLVIGPIPFDITPDYKYIKVYDGLASQVAVTRVTVEVLPSIALTPTWGPPGRMVTLTGVALLPNALLNLTYGAANASHDVFAQVWTDAKGKFSYTWSIRDLKAAWTGTGTIPSDSVYVYAWYNATGAFIDSVTYTEYRRSFVEVRSLKKGHVALSFTDLYTGAGNDTVTVEAFVFDTIVLAGAWWNPRDSVKIYIGGVLVKEVYPNETHGFFNTTFTVPELPMGINRVDVYNAGVRYVFYIYVLPTLVLIPEKGYVGDTVEVKGYGLPANSLVKIIWDALCVDTELKYNVNIVNGTTGPDGKFNVTVTFKVPKAPGGRHVVSAIVDTTNVTYAYFTILPRIRLEPSIISANYGGLIRVIGEGLDPSYLYYLAVDNSLLGWLACDSCGYAEGLIVGAGFRPGIHGVALYVYGYVGADMPPAYALFTVTCSGDPMCPLITSMYAMIEDIKGDVVYIKTSVGNIELKVDEVIDLIKNGVIVKIDEGVATILTEIGEVRTDLSTLIQLVQAVNATLVDVKGDVAVIKTGVSEIKVKLSELEPLIVEIRNNVVVMNTILGEVKASVAEVKSLVESSRNAIIAEIRSGVALILVDTGVIKAKLDTLSPVISEIRDGVVRLDTAIGEVKTSLDTIKQLVESSRDAVISEIKNGVATILTDTGVIKARVDAINATIVAVRDDVVTIKTDVGTVKSDLATIKPTVASISYDVATVKTELGELSGKIDAINGSLVVVETDVGTILATIKDVVVPGLSDIKSVVDAVRGDVSATRSDVVAVKATTSDIRDAVATIKSDVATVKSTVEPVPTLSTAIWLAVVFSLIAVILSAVVTVSVRRKIAG